MERSFLHYLGSIEPGGVKQFHNMAVIPLNSHINHGPEYLTLKEALEKRLLTITEIHKGGSVPELMAKNDADIPVLLLDGEELAGAKQNRVLNTTILLRERSETVIPVSCTEQGRWSYHTDEFYDSELIMAYKARSRKYQTVSDSLRYSRAFHADQGAVWNDIAEMRMDAGVNSQTGAMRDVFESKKANLDEYLGAFPLVEGQKGLLVIIGGKVVGFDIVSRKEAYAVLHSKFIKSYAMDALLEGKRKKSVEEPEEKLREKAKKFMASLEKCKEERYPSIGHGFDYRFEAPSLVGSALVAFEKVIHMAFFSVAKRDETGPMAGSSRRRRYRM